jgi:hypothetical protein
MSIRGWVAGKLGNEYVIEFEGEHGLRITRERLPTALVYCAEPDVADCLTVGDLDIARREMPGLQFVVLIRRDADNEAYERAEELGICLAGFGDLKSALDNDANIAQHLSREQVYLLSRLRKNRHVASIRRRGRSAYAISRKAPMSPLTIIASEDYELTSDIIYDLLDENDDIDLHAIVSTNPACFGFAGEVLDAGKRTGIRILSLNQLLDMLGGRWD